MTYPLLDYAIAREAERAIAELELLRCLLAAPIAARNVRDAGLRESDIGQPDLRVMYGACVKCVRQSRERLLSEMFILLSAGNYWNRHAHRGSRGMRWSALSLGTFANEFNPHNLPTGERMAVREAMRAAARVSGLALRSREASRHFADGCGLLDCVCGDPIREAAEIVKCSRLTDISVPHLIERIGRAA